MDDDERLIRALKELAAIETQKRQKKEDERKRQEEAAERRKRLKEYFYKKASPISMYIPKDSSLLDDKDDE